MENISPLSILARLEGGDRRSIGRSAEVVREVLARPELFGTLVCGLKSADELVRMRSADAIEKITAIHPEYLAPHKRALLRLASGATQQEVRWHMAQIVPRLRLTVPERERMAALFIAYLSDASSIVRACSMEALAELSVQEPTLLARTLPLIEELTAHGTPAMRARGRKLLARLAKHDGERRKSLTAGDRGAS